MKLFELLRDKSHPLWWMRKNRCYNWLVERFDFDFWVTIGSVRAVIRFWCDFSLLCMLKSHESKSLYALKELIGKFKIDTFMDVGANVGLYAWTALAANSGVTLFLFEPDETNLNLLGKTLKRNGITEAKLWSGVVADKAGIVHFLVDEVSGATGSMIDDRSNAWSLHSSYGLSKVREVSATTLDCYMNQVTGRVLIKIDVEGAESLVFQGARQFIAKHRPFIIVECFNLEHLKSLCGLNYSLVELPENCNRLLFPSELADDSKLAELLRSSEINSPSITIDSIITGLDGAVLV